MKEIIDNGKLEIKLINYCYNCGCRYSYQKEDIYFKPTASIICSYVTCPQCGEEQGAGIFPQ